MKPTRQSFFQRLTGSLREDEEEGVYRMDEVNKQSMSKVSQDREQYTIPTYEEEEEEEEDPVSVDGQLAIDVFETPVDVIVKTMIPGVRKEEVDISLSRDLLTIRGERKDEKTISEDNYHYRELYWGTFSRTLKLPHEVDIERAEATESQGMLTIKLPRVDKEKQAKIKVK
jgi:HSP20 family protein